MNKLPAILGGEPTFSQKIHIAKPTLSDFAAFSNEAAEIIASGILTKGKHLQKFEEMVAEHLEVKHALAVSSCTTGLMLAYQALNLTGEVIVPSFTFMATVSALIWAGARPRFVDVNLQTMNLDAGKIEEAISPQTSAIIAVHNFGNPADIDEIEQIAKRHNLRLIFDAAHGFGTLYQGKPVGKQGDAQVFSLSPTKLLVTGEGGIVSTNDDSIAEKIIRGREYGNNGNYDSAFAGINARMPEFNALLGQHSLSQLNENAAHRNKLAEIYRTQLKQIEGIEFQLVKDGNRSSYKDFSILLDPDLFGLTRNELADALTAEGIETRKYYAPPVHRQTAYRQFADENGALINTEILSENCLCLPMWSHLDIKIVEKICSAISRIQKYCGEIKEKFKGKSFLTRHT